MRGDALIVLAVNLLSLPSVCSCARSRSCRGADCEACQRVRKWARMRRGA